MIRLFIVHMSSYTCGHLQSILFISFTFCCSTLNLRLLLLLLSDQRLCGRFYFQTDCPVNSPAGDTSPTLLLSEDEAGSDKTETHWAETSERRPVEPQLKYFRQGSTIKSFQCNLRLLFHFSHRHLKSFWCFNIWVSAVKLQQLRPSQTRSPLQDRHTCSHTYSTEKLVSLQIDRLSDTSDMKVLMSSSPGKEHASCSCWGPLKGFESFCRFTARSKISPSKKTLMLNIKRFFRRLTLHCKNFNA